MASTHIYTHQTDFRSAKVNAREKDSSTVARPAFVPSREADPTSRIPLSYRNMLSVLSPSIMSSYHKTMKVHIPGVPHKTHSLSVDAGSLHDSALNKTDCVYQIHLIGPSSFFGLVSMPEIWLIPVGVESRICVLIPFFLLSFPMSLHIPFV